MHLVANMYIEIINQCIDVVEELQFLDWRLILRLFEMNNSNHFIQPFLLTAMYIPLQLPSNSNCLLQMFSELCEELYMHSHNIQFLAKCVEELIVRATLSGYSHLYF